MEESDVFDEIEKNRPQLEEVWVDIPEFPNYKISNCGRVFNNKTDRIMSVSFTNHGHSKISLINWRGRQTRSVALLVAQSFVEAPTPICTHVMALNGDLSDLRANNLALRPYHFCWKYTRQLKLPKPRHYINLPVLNVDLGIVHPSILYCCVEEGLLLEDVWRSTYSGSEVFPYRYTYKIFDRV